MADLRGANGIIISTQQGTGMGRFRDKENRVP